MPQYAITSKPALNGAVHVYDARVCWLLVHASQEELDEAEGIMLKELGYEPLKDRVDAYGRPLKPKKPWWRRLFGC